MQKTVLRYGGFSVLIVVFFFLVTWLVFSFRTPNYTYQAILNWIGIVLALVYVFVGIKYYRDEVNYGTLRVKEGMKVGLLIVLLPALVFGLIDALYVKYIDPAFFDKYYAFEVGQMQAGNPPNEWAAGLKKIEKRRKLFGSPGAQFVIMFLSVFMVGLIMTAFSTFLLKRRTRKFKAAQPIHPAF